MPGVLQVRVGSLAGSTACSSTQTTGTGYTRIQDLAGATLEAKLQAAPIDDVVTFGAGTNSFSNFTTIFNGVRVGAGTTRKGIVGTGVGSTIFQMTALTSTRASEDPATGTNQLYLLYFEHDDLRLRCFTIQGTDQNHRYNGVRMHGVANGVVENLKLISAAPGDDFVPPGETFAINDYLGNNNVFRDIEIDGQAGTTGYNGASGCGANTYNTVKYERIIGYDNIESAAIAIWEGIGTSWIIDCDSTRNRTAFNIERIDRATFLGAGNEATIHIVNPKFGQIMGFGQDIFLGNDQGSATIHIYDPQWYTSGQGRDNLSGHGAVGEIRIFFPSLEQGNPNLQLQSDVHVWQGGSWTGTPGAGGTYSGGTDNAATIINWSPF